MHVRYTTTLLHLPTTSLCLSTHNKVQRWTSYFTFLQCIVTPSLQCQFPIPCAMGRNLRNCTCVSIDCTRWRMTRKWTEAKSYIIRACHVPKVNKGANPHILRMIIAPRTNINYNSNLPKTIISKAVSPQACPTTDVKGVHTSPINPKSKSPRARTSAIPPRRRSRDIKFQTVGNLIPCGWIIVSEEWDARKVSVQCSLVQSASTMYSDPMLRSTGRAGNLICWDMAVWCLVQHW